MKVPMRHAILPRLLTSGTPSCTVHNLENVTRVEQLCNKFCFANVEILTKNDGQPLLLLEMLLDTLGRNFLLR